MTHKPPGLRIRLASVDDLEAIRRIADHYVLHSTATYQEKPWTDEEAHRWFNEHGADKPVTVAELNQAVVGYGALGLFRAKSGYRFTVEHSVYVHPDRHRQGIGAALLADLIRRARELGYHMMIAGIDADQAASLAIHAKFGFVKVAHFSQVGFKFGRWIDAVFMQLPLDGRAANA
jgi:L-amino acid N-acyltransferase